MKFCRNCNGKIPAQITIDGKERNLQNRTQCLSCLPFGRSPYTKKTDEEKRSLNSKKMRNWISKKRSELGADPINLLRKDRKSQIVTALGGSCFLCGYDRCLRNLIFHHIREKSFSLDERRFQYSWKKLLPELMKCVLLCHNCHGEVHEGLVPRDTIQGLEAKTQVLLNFEPTRLSLASGTSLKVFLALCPVSHFQYVTERLTFDLS